MRDFPDFEGPMASWPSVEVIPHVKNVLPELHASWIIGLATNAQDSDEKEIREALRRGGIERWIDEIYCFRRIGIRKPSTAFFDYILKDLRIDGSHVVFVGDSLETDIRGARDAGIHAVWFNAQRSKEEPGTETIEDFRELPSFLMKWDRGREKNIP
jgi:putative hydrolase of the HAD superfamily